MSIIQGHDSIAGEGRKHHGPGLGAYLIVGAALAIFTASSFVFNEMVRNDKISKMTGLACIIGVAVCKAVLVGAFFMHLTYDWRKLYFLIVPALVLGVMMMLVLMPDGVVTWADQRQIDKAAAAAAAEKP